MFAFSLLFLATVNDPVDQLIYHWDFGDGGSGSNKEVSHIYDQADHKYDISLNGISSLTGCSDTLGAKDFVWVYPKPKAVFTMDNAIVYNDKPTVHFLNINLQQRVFLRTDIICEYTVDGRILFLKR